MYINCLFFNIFSEPAKFKFRQLYLCALTGLFVVSLLLVENVLLNLCILIVVVLLSSFAYKMHWYIHIFLSIATILLSSLCEQIVALSIGAILAVDIVTLKSGYYFIIGGLLAKFLSFVIVAIISIGKHTKLYGKSNLSIIYMSLLPVSSFLVVFIFIDYINRIENNIKMQTLTLSVLFLLIITNILVYYVIDRLYESFLTEKNLATANQLIKMQKEQYNNLYQNQRQIQAIRHDAKNTMLGIIAELKAGNKDAVIQSMETFVEDMSKTSIQFTCGNNTLDAIINSKLQQAKTHGISFDICINGPIGVYLDPIEFAVLLGNALDNAIEATTALQTNPKTISIHIVFQAATMITIIENPIMKKVDVNNLVTNKADPLLHGYGIPQMKSIAQKYNGDVFFDSTDCKFKTSIIISNNKPKTE